MTPLETYITAGLMGLSIGIAADIAVPGLSGWKRFWFKGGLIVGALCLAALARG